MRSAVDAHIEGQWRLRAQAAARTQAAWESLGSWDEADVDRFLTIVVPLILGAQRASSALTNAFLAFAVGRQPLPLDPDRITGAFLRAGSPPADVYRRPFVSYWAALKEGKPWDDAIGIGLERATSTAEMDVQLAMRQTLVEVGAQDAAILGYRRVPDGDACEFCRLIAGRRYLTADLLEVHNRCGCGVDVITAANRGDFTGKRDNDLPPQVAIHQHGELGPVIADAAHDFTDQAALAA
jgi:hypothetical protein